MRWTADLIRDDSGDTYVEYVALTPLVAIMMIAGYAALYGAPGQYFKNTIQTIAFGYAEGFENGVPAPGPYWSDVRPAGKERHEHEPNVDRPTVDRPTSGILALLAPQIGVLHGSADRPWVADPTVGVLSLVDAVVR